MSTEPIYKPGDKFNLNGGLDTVEVLSDGRKLGYWYYAVKITGYWSCMSYYDIWPQHKISQETGRG